MKVGRLIVQPMGGLANRIRVLAFAKHVTDSSQTDLKCLWNVDDELYSPFEKLFISDGLVIKNVYGKQWQLFKCRKWYKNIPAYLWLRLHRVDVWLSYDHICEAITNETEEERQQLTKRIERELRAGKTVYLSTGAYLGAYTDISFIKPTAEIMQKVNDALNAFESGHSYGLHIRRADNIWSIEHSPIELFENKIEEIIPKDPKAKFYLSTDDIETANLLRTKYGHYIVYRDKELSRISENGMREAVIDMWILGNMDAIYGSYWSSFSEVAAWIHHKPVKALCNN